MNFDGHNYALRATADELSKPKIGRKCITTPPNPNALLDHLNVVNSGNNQTFLTTLHTMTVFGSGGSTLSRQENTLLRIAIFTLLKTDGGTDPSYLNEKIQTKYGSQNDPVGAFRTDLIAWMEKQGQGRQ